MGQLDNLGKARNANQLAKELDIPKSTIYNNPKAFGGIRIGGRWWFFDKLVVEAIRSQALEEAADASVEKGRERQEGSVWQNQDKRQTKSTEVRDLGRGSEVGAGTEGQSQELGEIDPHGLLNLT